PGDSIRTGRQADRRRQQREQQHQHNRGRQPRGCPRPHSHARLCPAVPVAEQVMTLNIQEAGKALEFAVDELIEATAKTFEQDDDEDEDDEDTDVTDADEVEDDDDDEDQDEERDEEDEEDDGDLLEDEDKKTERGIVARRRRFPLCRSSDCDGGAAITTVGSIKTDAAGILPSKAARAPKSVDDNSEVVLAGGDYRLGQVKPEDSPLPPLDFATMLKSLGQLSLRDVQDWFNIGSNLAKVVGVSSESNNGKSEGEEGSDSKKEEKEAKAAASKDLFNQFVSKTASFANWTLTPETLDQTGVFDRVQQSLGHL
ncbi:hypothetical protein BG015_011617, partial [Linnemannia schmuckeri]